MVFPVRGELLDEPFPATVNNVSAETVGLVQTRAMMPSAGLVIRIPVADNQYLAIRCRVMRCSHQSDGRFFLVAQFQELVDPQTTFTLLNRAQT